MSIFSSEPVMASKPVAKTTQSNEYSLPPTTNPRGVSRSIRCLLTSTRCTFGRLNVSK